MPTELRLKWGFPKEPQYTDCGSLQAPGLLEPLYLPCLEVENLELAPKNSSAKIRTGQDFQASDCADKAEDWLTGISDPVYNVSLRINEKRLLTPSLVYPSIETAKVRLYRSMHELSRWGPIRAKKTLPEDYIRPYPWNAGSI